VFQLATALYFYRYENLRELQLKKYTVSRILAENHKSQQTKRLIRISVLFLIQLDLFLKNRLGSLG